MSTPESRNIIALASWFGLILGIAAVAMIESPALSTAILWGIALVMVWFLVAQVRELWTFYSARRKMFKDLENDSTRNPS